MIRQPLGTFPQNHAPGGDAVRHAIGQNDLEEKRGIPHQNGIAVIDGGQDGAHHKGRQEGFLWSAVPKRQLGKTPELLLLLI